MKAIPKEEAEFMTDLIEAIQSIHYRHYGTSNDVFVMFLNAGPKNYASTDACPVHLIDALQKVIAAIMVKMSLDEFEICDDCPGLGHEQ